MNLINELTDKFGTDIVNGLSLNLGAGNDSVEKSVHGTLPALLGGLINKVQTKKGAGELHSLLNKKEYDGALLNKMGNLFSGSESINLLKNGLDVLPMMLGGQSKMGTVLNIAGGLFGGGLSRSQSVFGMLAPVLLNFIGKKMRADKLNQKGLVDLLLGQKDVVQKNTHKDIAKEMGFAKWDSDQPFEEEESDELAKEETFYDAYKAAKPKRRFPNWLIPFGVVVGAIAALFLLTRACGEIPEEKRKAMEAKKTQQQESRTQQESKKVESKQQLNTLQNQQTKPANTKTTPQKPPVRQNTNTTRPGNQNQINNQANQNINTAANRPNATPTQQPLGGRKGIQNRPNSNANNQQVQTPKTSQTSQTPKTPGNQQANTAQSNTTTATTRPGTSNTAATPPTKTQPKVRPGVKNNANTSTNVASKYRGSVSLVDKAAITKTTAIVNLSTVTTDNKTLTRSAESNFKKIAQIMKDNPTTKITLRAHNQDFSDATKNATAKKLGITRANILQKLLVSEGVQANRIKVESLGNTELLIKQDPGNTRNQRISVKIN